MCSARARVVPCENATSFPPRLVEEGREAASISCTSWHQSSPSWCFQKLADGGLASRHSRSFFSNFYVAKTIIFGSGPVVSALLTARIYRLRQGMMSFSSDSPWSCRFQGPDFHPRRLCLGVLTVSAEMPGLPTSCGRNRSPSSPRIATVTGFHGGVEGSSGRGDG